MFAERAEIKNCNDLQNFFGTRFDAHLKKGELGNSAVPLIPSGDLRNFLLKSPNSCEDNCIALSETSESDGS